MSFSSYPQYKDGGVEWLGSVPNHWIIQPLKRCIQHIEQGWSPECENRLKEADEWGVLKVGCVNGGVFNPSEHKALPATLEPKIDIEVKQGDVLISRANTRELVGSVAIVENWTPQLLLCDKLFRLRLKSTIDDNYLWFFLGSQTARNWIELHASGASSSMQNISQETLKEIVIALPPLSEQHAIVTFLKTLVSGKFT